MWIYKSCLNDAKWIGATLIEATCYQNLGALEKSRERYDRALYYYRKALTRFQQLLNEDGMAHCQQQISACTMRYNREK